jgi:Spy/CpxP family protein refolding chaperone
MKKLFSAIFALSLLSSSVFAQEKTSLKQYKKDVYKTGHHGKREQHKEMMKDLNLTESQKQQMKANHEEFKNNMEALNKEQNITVKEMNERKAALRQQQKAKNDAIFTPEQKEKLAAAKLKHEADAKAHREKKVAEMKTKLSLTDDQVTKIKAQNENTTAQIKAINENKSLDEASKRQQILALKNLSREQRKSVLTAEQQKTLQDSKREEKGKMPRK